MSFYCNEEFKEKNNLPSFIFPNTMFCGIKDLGHRIVAMNNKTAHLLGFESAERMLKNPIYDHEIQCRASELAQDFRVEDKISSHEEPAIVLSQCYYRNNEKKLFLSEKSNINNAEGKSIGTFITNIDITATRVINLQPLLSSGWLRNRTHDQFSIVIKPSYPDLKLTDRQNECLYYIINGYSSAGIGEICHLSKRTVESYIEHIKNKLRCTTKQELIEKAISLGYLEIIPQVIFDKYAKGLTV